MNEKTNRLKNIILLIILLLIVILILIFTLKQDNSQEYNNSIDTEKIDKIQLLEVSDIKTLYNLEQCIRKYFDGINDSDKLEISSDIDDNKTFYINRAYIIEPNSKNTIYFAKGTFINNDLENKRVKQQSKLIITVDNDNQTFDIALYGNKYKDIFGFQDNIIDTTFIEDKIKQINETIEYQSYNFWSNDDVADEKLAKRFYEDYKINALYFPNDAYEMIDEEYKKERFSTFNSFKQYLDKNRVIIEESVLSKYSVDTSQEYIEYTVVDTNQNSYFIRIDKNSMKYTIFLDNYTIKSVGYEDRYNALSDENKTSTNVAIFMSMINTGDYSHAYNLLDDNFKQNNFKTQKLFEQYIKSNFFDYNIVNIEKVDKQGSYYVCKLSLMNNNSSISEKKELTIIMKLLEETDFVMSFNIK